MFSEIQSCAMMGLSGELIRVEVDISNGIPAFTIVGLPSAAVREAKERVRSAMINRGIDFPLRRVTVNLFPADLPKEGSHLDLPMAVGIIAAVEGMNGRNLKDMAFLGELSLNGKINGILGAMAFAMSLKERGICKLVLPRENLEEVLPLSGMEFFPLDSLEDVREFLLGNRRIPSLFGGEERISGGERDGAEGEWEDYSDVRGQREALRGALIAAGGFHSLLLSGPPGSGKSLIIKRLPGIMPEMSQEERMEVTRIYSAAGLYRKTGTLMNQRPFRSPHHSISAVAMIGGGRIPRPGEITLAHEGVLFLDEMAEFGRDRLEALRQPLEDGTVTVSRVNGTVSFPARFLLAGACNPCPCGYYGSGNRDCICTMQQIQRYQRRLSGPLLDRFDLFLSVAPVESFEMLGRGREETPYTTDRMRRQVKDAWEIQRNRYEKAKVKCNSRLTPEMIGEFCVMSEEAEDFLKEAFHVLKLSARAAHRVVKVARTIADLEGSERIELIHVAEAANYRRRADD